MAAPARADDDLPGRVGRVAEQGGELFLSPQDAPDQWVAIGINYPVTTGDNLWVGKEGRAEIDFGAGQARLAGDTSLHVSRLDDRIFSLFVAQGRVIVRIRVLDPGDAARIDTPNAQVLLTRPGLYRIEVSEDRQHTQLAVREGEANIDTGVTVQQVLPGQSATLDGAAPQDAQLRSGVTTDGFDTWSANRDRYYDRGRANSPVSRQMVGAADLDQYGAWDTAPEYGAVWYPANVAADWAPYRNGYWTDVGAWGPTWVDYAPWGYAPFHYGRWAFIGGRWGWCPGRHVARPVWAPALVVWVGGPGWRFAPGASGLRLGAPRMGRGVPPALAWLLGRLLGALQQAVCGERLGSHQRARDTVRQLERARRRHRGLGRDIHGAQTGSGQSRGDSRQRAGERAGFECAAGSAGDSASGNEAGERPSTTGVDVLQRRGAAGHEQQADRNSESGCHGGGAAGLDRPASSPPLRVAPPAGKPIPIASSPQAGAGGPPVARTTSPAIPPAGMNPVYVPPARIEAKPALQTPPAPVARRCPTVARRQRLPNAGRERGPVAVPTLAPAPQAVAPAPHLAPAAPAPHAAPVGAGRRCAGACAAGLFRRARQTGKTRPLPRHDVPGEGPAK